ncbi:MAG: dihydroorotate dehydrogenase (quinone) [Betaproteobacteria bacterium RIFCSPLOWO2_02_FULL_62_17]|nr:MAG: dihydroorotate dehydrogenase (quinone) [Betaproteobacteria bacterium RIFCSPLOWO2_02_FULL_62_17]
MLYRLARPLLFCLDAETAHRLGLALLDGCHAIGLSRMLASAAPRLPVRAMDIDFPNPVGLAAGMDKNGDHIDALLDLGFGFVEVGAVTPRPQPGNPRPRMFRLTEAQAIINRMGFNNLGVDHLVENLRRRKPTGIVGVNVGKNFDTPIERASEDYVHCLQKVYPHASFVTANVSSPNTSGLRNLQHDELLDNLLGELASARADLIRSSGRHVPIAVKIAPDLDDAGIDALADRVIAHGLDAVIATNTTLSRAGVEHLPASREAGGLSGGPLRKRSTQVIVRLARALSGRVPIIGVGGISTAADAAEKLRAGATLLQLYSALVFEGPGLVGKIVAALAQSR